MDIRCLRYFGYFGYFQFKILCILLKEFSFGFIGHFGIRFCKNETLCYYLRIFFPKKKSVYYCEIFLTKKVNRLYCLKFIIMDNIDFADIDFSATNRSRIKTCSKCNSAQHTITKCPMNPCVYYCTYILVVLT